MLSFAPVGDSRSGKSTWVNSPPSLPRKYSTRFYTYQRKEPAREFLGVGGGGGESAPNPYVKTWGQMYISRWNECSRMLLCIINNSTKFESFQLKTDYIKLKSHKYHSLNVGRLKTWKRHTIFHNFTQGDFQGSHDMQTELVLFVNVVVSILLRRGAKPGAHAWPNLQNFFKTYFPKVWISTVCWMAIRRLSHASHRILALTSPPSLYNPSKSQTLKPFEIGFSYKSKGSGSRTFY